MFLVRKIRVIFFVLLLVILVQPKSLAAELNLPNVTITPDKYLMYSGKRFLEKGIIFTKFNKDSKKDFYKELTLIRLAELKYVAEKKLLGEAQHSTQRLSYQIGVLSDYISSNPELQKDKKSTTEFLLSFKELLGNLRDIYPANSPYWLLIQHNINSIDLNLEKLK